MSCYKPTAQCKFSIIKAYESFLLTHLCQFLSFHILYSLPFMPSFALDDLEQSLAIVEVSKLFLQLDASYRVSFVQYLQDEWAAIDDEFSSIVDAVTAALYASASASHPSTVETHLHDNLNPPSNPLHPLTPSTTLLVLQSVISYIQQELHSTSS